MPATLNGIGTRYSGERNTQVRNGYCKSCNRYASLRSYDTTLFFVILFIPIIPLGKKRIIDECSSCRRHYVVNLSEYQRAREADYQKANGLLANTANEDDMLRGLGLLAGYQNPQDVGAAVTKLEATFPNSAKTHGVVGEIHRLMSRFDLAEQSLSRSLALEENVDVREAVAELQFARSDPDAGRATLEPILAQPGARATRATAMAADAFQRQGRHEEALSLLAKVTLDESNPELNKSLSKLRASSEHHLQRALVEPDKYVIDPNRGVVMRKRVKFLPLKIAAAATLAVGAIYAGVCMYLGQRQKVYVINGSERGYTMKVAGKTSTLMPGQIEKMKVAQGKIDFAISDPSYLGTPGAVEYTSNFLFRPFNSDVVIINPDGQARLTHERVYYAPVATTPPAPGMLAELIGQTSYIIKGADYPFETPPSTMQLDSKTNSKAVTVLYNDNVSSKLTLLGHYMSENSTHGDALASRLREWTLDGTTTAAAAVAIMKPDERLAHLKAQLAIRPVVVHAHRMYQETMETTDLAHDLVGEYQQLLDAEPENPTLMYLLARITNDVAKSSELLAKAENASPPEPMAFIADAYRQAAAGDFNAVLQTLNRIKQDPSVKAMIPAQEFEAQVALRHWDEALELIPRIRDSTRYDAILNRLEVQVLAGRMIETDGEMSALLDPLKAQDADRAKNAQTIYDAHRAYMRDNEPQFARLLKDAEDPELRFAAALSGSDLATASKLMKDEQLDQPDAALQLYIAATCGGNTLVQSTALQTALDVLRAGDNDHRLFATYLDGSVKPTRKELLEFSSTPAFKAVCLTALGCRWPALRQDAFGLSYSFDYGLRYPHCLLKRARATVKG